MKKQLVVAVLAMAVLAASTPAAAQQVTFLVRHAERADGGAAAPAQGMMANDPPLSPAGEQRAARLASMLASADIRSVFITEYRRTRQTAEPLATQFHLTPVTVAARQPDLLIAQVLKAHGNVLVVGHSNTVPDLIKELGIAETVTIGDSDYDNLFVVVRSKAGDATLIKLKF